jgi:hypothetical protein
LARRPVRKLIYAALMRIRQGWRNVIITPFEIKEIETLRDHLRNEFDQRHASYVEADGLSLGARVNLVTERWHF